MRNTISNTKKTNIKIKTLFRVHIFGQYIDLLSAGYRQISEHQIEIIV